MTVLRVCSLGISLYVLPQCITCTQTTLPVAAMRYQTWDVLMFPGESRTPIQEFDTKCFVLDQSKYSELLDSRTLSLTFIDVGSSAADGTSERSQNTFESMTLVPILTCFVASLERGAPFRISIHSWDTPRPSQLLLSYKTPNEATLFEARIYVDGVFVA